MSKTRRLVITVAPNGGWVSETEYLSGAGYWSCLSRTVTTTFPFLIVSRVAGREDYAILIRGAK